MKNFKKMLLFVVATFMLMINANADEITLQSKINDAGKTKTTITLDKTYTESITINKGQDITIDLNGYTLNGHVIDLGTLTVKSSKTGGKIVSPYLLYIGMYRVDETTKKVVQNDAGKFILESGTIEVTGDNYGIYCMSGSTAIVNGGEINSKYSAIAGNNTTGTMHFEVNGGVLNTEEGPSIYMPGPVDLKVTGGTLNGGISLRMGKIDISGGVINAGTKNFDSFEKYYNYSGNASFTDAIYILGGTYTSKDEGHTNELTLNITGGTINVTNEQGSAVAIYDMGKVEQKMSVNISGSAKLITNSTTRNAYDVLTLAEAGIATPAAGYNNPNYTGKVVSTITGGTFSSDVSKYVAEGYVQQQVKEEYIVAKKEVKVDTLPTIDTSKETVEVEEVTIGVKKDETVDKTLQDAIQADEKLAAAVKDISSVVEISVENQEEKAVPAEAAKSIAKLVADTKTEDKAEMKVASFFDITLNVNNSLTGAKVGVLTQLAKKLTFNVALPENLTKVDEGYTRTYYIVRYHDGESEILDTKLSGNVLTFATDKFSTYAIAYKDTAVKSETETETETKTDTTTKTETETKTDTTAKTDTKEEVNPSTGDNIVLYLATGIIALAGIGYTALNIYKRKNN